MKSKPLNKSSYINIIFFSLLIIILNSCNSCNDNRLQSRYVPQVPVPPAGLEREIGKVTYFIENSESMFGYVRGRSEYVSVVSELAEKPEFVQENTPRVFYFINGGQNLCLTFLGNDPLLFKNRLNVNGYRCGDITRSNLNGIFLEALKKAKGDSISILISDGIYDIGLTDDPLRQLEIEKTGIRSRFIERLNDSSSNLQTLMIKLNSSFNGTYFFSSRRGGQQILQKRPYYVWIFGESELLNKYFSEKYIKEHFVGYESMVRFFRYDNISIPYQATANNLIGSFRFDRYSINRLIMAEPDRNGMGFQFDIAVDFNSLPLPESYKIDSKNYLCTGTFNVTEIKKLDKKLYGITKFVPTHLITVKTEKSPYGTLEINLKNVTPEWIRNTHSGDEALISIDSLHTFGFKYLTDGITDAYKYISKGEHFGSFKLEILKNK